MKQEIKIGDRTISEHAPIFIVAECGVTCNYDVKIAKELIDVVAASGADAIKFFFCYPDEFMADRSIVYNYSTVNGPASENMFEMFEKMRFSMDEWREIRDHARARGVIPLCTVDSKTGIKMTEELGFGAYKLSSWDFNHLEFWREVIKQGKPLIIDTGPVDLLDIAKVMKIMEEEGNDQAIFVHCFHTEVVEEFNMRSIPYMRQAFNAPVGWAARDRSNDLDYMAVAMGASFIEKRLTLSRNLPGHHHILSLEPSEFSAWVKSIRQAQASLGELALKPTKNDLAERKKWFRHLVAEVDIPSGTTLAPSMLEGKRPGNVGISAEHLRLFVGRKLKRSVKRNEAITWDDV